MEVTKKRKRSYSKNQNGSKTGVARQPRAVVGPTKQVRANRPFRIVRAAHLQDITVPTAVPGSTFLNFNLAFRLADMTAITDFTALFATYKITKIKVDLVPKFTYGTFVLQAAAHTPTLLATVLNSATSPTTESLFLQRENVTIQPVTDRRLSWTFRPFTANSGEVSSVANALSYDDMAELDIASTSIWHYGLSLGFLSQPNLVGSGEDLVWSVYVTYWMSFYDPV